MRGADASPGSLVKIEGVDEMLELPTRGLLTLPQLQRIRRQFIAMRRMPMMAVGKGGGGGSLGGEVGEEGMRREFVAYLNGQFEAGA